MSTPNTFTVTFTFTLLTALGCGLSAGLFFIFSNTIMKALGRIDAAAGIAAMQVINDVILNPTFVVVFMGTAVVSIGWLVSALMGWREHGGVYLILGSVIYLVGCILVTIIFNVPMNNALAAVPPTDPNSVAIWSDYLVRWTLWNHVRTVAAIVATVSFMLALGR